MDKGANMIWHLSAAVEVLGQAVYAAGSGGDHIEATYTPMVERIMGEVQNIIAHVEAEQAEAKAVKAMMTGDEADDIIDAEEARALLREQGLNP